MQEQMQGLLWVPLEASVCCAHFRFGDSAQPRQFLLVLESSFALSLATLLRASPASPASL